MAILFKDVSFKINSKNIIKNFNCKIEDGTTNLISGENGAGKTTFIYLLLGIFQENTGEILIDGKKLTKNTLSNWREQLIYIEPKVDRQFLTNKVFDELIFKSENNGKKRGQMDAILASQKKLYNFEKSYNHKINELSNVEKIWLAILMQYTGKEKYLVIDESMSIIPNKEMKNILEIMKRNGITIIFTSHDETSESNLDQIIKITKEVN